MTLHGIWISGAWVFKNKNINHHKLRFAIQNSLNAMPWLSARITNISLCTSTIVCNNQGVKYNIVCHPQLSIDPSNKKQYEHFQNALKPYNRNIFFTDDKPPLCVKSQDIDKVP